MFLPSYPDPGKLRNTSTGLWNLAVYTKIQVPCPAVDAWKSQILEFWSRTLPLDAQIHLKNIESQYLLIPFIWQFILGWEFDSSIASPKAPSEELWDNHSSAGSREMRRKESLGAAPVWGWLWLPQSPPAAPWREDRARYGMGFLSYFSHRADMISSGIFLL